MHAPFPKPAPTQAERNAAYAGLAAAHGLLPVKVTPFYQQKIAAEQAALGHEGGPLHRVMYPTAERLQLHAPHEVADWVADRRNMPGGGKNTLIQKYPDRVLFTPTAICAAHCLYCFRQDLLAEQKQESDAGLEAKLATLITHLHANPQTSEVLLSGGDPLMLAYPALELILQRIAAVKTIRSIRINSRAAIFAPSILQDDKKLALFAKTGVRFVFHIIHPYEICEEVAALLVRMHRHGIRLYNQFPLLRHTNDHAEVLLALLHKLEQHHVRTYSIFVPEPIPFSATYRLRYDRMCGIIDAVQRVAPPWLTGFRFCLDSPVGKVRREQLVGRDAAADTLLFDYHGEKISYPDFPAHMDNPGDVKTMLWQSENAYKNTGTPL